MVKPNKRLWYWRRLIQLYEHGLKGWLSERGLILLLSGPASLSISSAQLSVSQSPDSIHHKLPQPLSRTLPGMSNNCPRFWESFQHWTFRFRFACFCRYFVSSVKSVCRSSWPVKIVLNAQSLYSEIATSQKRQPKVPVEQSFALCCDCCVLCVQESKSYVSVRHAALGCLPFIDSFVTLTMTPPPSAAVSCNFHCSCAAWEQLAV